MALSCKKRKDALFAGGVPTARPYTLFSIPNPAQFGKEMSAQA